MELMETLQFYRKRQGLSQVELAEALDVSRQTISKWETGAALPSAENLLALSKLYGVPVDDLLNGVETETAPPDLLPTNVTSPPSPAPELTVLPRKKLILRIIAVVFIIDLLFYPWDFYVWNFAGYENFFRSFIFFIGRIALCTCIGLWFARQDRARPVNSKHARLISIAALAAGVYYLLFPVPAPFDWLFDFISGGWDLESDFNIPAYPLRMCLAQNLCDCNIFFSHMCLIAAFQLGRLWFSRKKQACVSRFHTVHQI